MAKQVGPIFLVRTIGDIIFYKMNGLYYVRMKPVFPDIRKSPRFRGTMQSARRMGRASKIGAALYKALPGGLKRFAQYRVLTGKAFYLLKEGKTDAQALQQLWDWQKDLVERGCAIAATVYDALGVAFRREWMLWAFAEEAMALLDGGKADAEVMAQLWGVYAGEFEAGYREERGFQHAALLGKENEKKPVQTEPAYIYPLSGLAVSADGAIVYRNGPLMTYPYSLQNNHTRVLPGLITTHAPPSCCK